MAHAQLQPTSWLASRPSKSSYLLAVTKGFLSFYMSASIPNLNANAFCLLLQVPIMLKSLLCSLRDVSDLDLMGLGECPYDQVSVDSDVIWLSLRLFTS